MLEIRAGTAFHLWCTFCTEPKHKFFVVAYTTPRLRYFLINSAPAAFQRANSTLMAHQAPLLCADVSFLKRDSVLDCSEVKGGPTLSEIEDMVVRGEDISRGRLPQAIRRNVRRIVESSELLSAKEIAAILKEW